MIVSKDVRLTMAAVWTALLLSACGAGSQATGMHLPDPAASPSSQQVSPAAGSLQDMLDLYALKRQLSALRREPAASGGGCNALTGGSIVRAHHT